MASEIVVDPVVRALARLRRYRKFVSLNAPLPILSREKKLLDDSKRELGDQWHLVEEQYERFKEVRDAEIAEDQAWEDRCWSCTHWIGPFWEREEPEALDNETAMWCDRYRVEDMTKPEPCPDFGEKKEGVA